MSTVKPVSKRNGVNQKDKKFIVSVKFCKTERSDFKNPAFQSKMIGQAHWLLVLKGKWFFYPDYPGNWKARLVIKTYLKLH